MFFMQTWIAAVYLLEDHQYLLHHWVAMISLRPLLKLLKKDIAKNFIHPYITYINTID